MLDTFRKLSHSWYAKIFFALLAAVFVLWGISGEVLQRASNIPAIVVGKEDISAKEVADAFRRDAERLQAMSGGKITVEQARQLGVMQSTIQQLVNRSLLDQAAGELKLTVNTETLQRMIAAEPAFQNELKLFDKALYERALARAGLSEQAFVRDERGNLLRDQLVRSISGGIKAPSLMVDPLFRHQQEQRVAETVSFPTDKMAAPAKPDDGTLQAFYKAHQDQFMAPELRGITAILVRTADVASDIHPSEEDIAKSFEIRQAEFQTAEKRSIQQLLFSDEAKAKAFAESANQPGKDFAAEAKAAGQSVIDLGWVDRTALPFPALAAAAFAPTAPGVTGPVQSPLGWHVLRVSAIVPGKSRPQSEVRDVIVQGLVKDEATNRLYALSTKIEDAIGSGAPIEEAASSLNLKPLKVAALDAQGNGPDGKPAPGVPLLPAFLATAFQTGQGVTSEVQSLDNNAGYFVLHVDSVSVPAVKPFDTIKDQVAAAWTTDQKEHAARKQAEAAAERLKKGEDIAAVAAPFKVETSKPFRRAASEDSPLPPQLIGEMFQAQPGGISVVDSQGGAMVGRLKQVIAADPATQAAAFEAARRKLSQELGNDVMQQYVTTLQKDLGVTIHTSLIDQQFEK